MTAGRIIIEGNHHSNAGGTEYAAAKRNLYTGRYPLHPDGAAREGLDKALSLFKMEGVWLGAVTALSAEDAQKALEKAGLNSYFRFVLTESVALCKADSGTMFERAMKRLHSQKDDTIVFSGSLAAIQNAKDAGFRTVAVRGGAEEEVWRAMRTAAAQSLAQYSELLSDSV